MNITAKATDFIPTKEDVDGLLKTIKTGVEAVVQDHANGIHPIIFVLCKHPIDAEPVVMAHAMVTDFNSALGKKKAMKIVAANVYEAKLIPVAVGMVSEAWMGGAQSGDWNEYRKKYLMIADDPERVEVAVCSVLGSNIKDKKRLAAMDCRKLASDSEGRVSWDGDWMFQNKQGEGCESALIDHFYEAYYDFAHKHENHKDYLALAIVAPAESFLRSN